MVTLYAAGRDTVRAFESAVSGTGVVYSVAGPERPRYADYVITGARLNSDVERFARDLTAPGSYAALPVVLPDAQEWFAATLKKAQGEGRHIVVVGAELRNPIVR